MMQSWSQETLFFKELEARHSAVVHTYNPSNSDKMQRSVGLQFEASLGKKLMRLHFNH
jgi:hypothetical protein